MANDVVDALQNDECLKTLYAKLNELQAKAIPVVIRVSPTEFRASYSDEYNESYAKLRKEINFRQAQILVSYAYNNE